MQKHSDISSSARAIFTATTFRLFLDRFVYDNRGSLLFLDFYVLSIAFYRKNTGTTQFLQQEGKTIVGLTPII